MITSHKFLNTLILVATLALITHKVHARGAKPSELGAIKLPIGSEAVIWYSTWETALTEAKRSNRPIFYMAAAHQCGSVSGTF